MAHFKGPSRAIRTKINRYCFGNAVLVHPSFWCALGNCAETMGEFQLFFRIQSALVGSQKIKGNIGGIATRINFERVRQLLLRCGVG